MYYDALRRKVEDKGTENFPEQGGKKLYGELIMIVTVNHDGRVLSTEVVQGSGKAALDRRARSHCPRRRAVWPLHPEMRAKADQVAMVARFKFTREQTLETSVRVTPFRRLRTGAASFAAALRQPPACSPCCSHELLDAPLRPVLRDGQPRGPTAARPPSTPALPNSPASSAGATSAD